MSEDQIAEVVEAFGGLLGLLRQAEPHDHAEIHTRIGL
jgi:site-specific DNA recombinase